MVHEQKCFKKKFEDGYLQLYVHAIWIHSMPFPLTRSEVCWNLEYFAALIWFNFMSAHVL